MLTAGELQPLANRIANGLQALGVQPDDTLALVLPNSAEMIAAYLAGTQIGCYLTPINHHLVGPEIAYIVGDSGAKALIGHERFAERAAKALDELGDAAPRAFAIGEVAGFRPFDELMAASPTPRRRTGSPGHRCTTRRAPPASPRA